MSVAARLAIDPNPQEARTAQAAVSLPHLRGWLAAFPVLPPIERCDFCNGTKVYACYDCRRHPGHDRHGEICDACGGKPCEACPDCAHLPFDKQLAEILGVRIEPWILRARTARLRSEIIIARVRNGKLALGRTLFSPYVQGPHDRVIYEAAYAHEQLPLRIHG